MTIASAGRFHVLDLARELDALGHKVRFYSFLPRRRAASFGLRDECHASLFPFVFSLLLWERMLPKLGRRLREWMLYGILNRTVILQMGQCDVFIFMSGIYLEAALAAKRRFGARLWLERGSQHVLAQDEILAAAGGERPTARTIRRELAGYGIADRIVIPSLHVEDSFRRDATAYQKLFRNPYGVDIEMFTPGAPRTPAAPITMLYVGTWSLQKGCDVLTAAVRRANVRLLHVGAIADFAFPRMDPRFAHSDPVPQHRLRDFYIAADAFVLASRQDGFGMVLSQALACGLPVIATDRTGARDIASIPEIAERIFTVPSGNADALAETISALQRRLISEGAFPPLRAEQRAKLSWATYARRYNKELLCDVASRQKECVPSMS